MSEKRELKVGDMIRDNDPWYVGLHERVLRIRDLDVSKYPIVRAIASHPDHPKQNETRIRIDRIYTDGKPRRSGWSLVP